MAILSGIERIDEALLNSAELDHAATEEAVARRQTARKTRKRTQTAPRSLSRARSSAPTHPRAYGSFARVLGHYVNVRRPHQLSAGVSEVLVNGKVTIGSGAFTGELAGRALAGPGARR
jgi:hypothetical protein